MATRVGDGNSEIKPDQRRSAPANLVSNRIHRHYRQYGTTAFAEIFLCLNSVAQLKVELAVQVNCTGRFLQKTWEPGKVYWEMGSFSGQVKVNRKWINWGLVPHEKGINIRTDIIIYGTSLLYLDVHVVCWPETTGNSNYEKQLGSQELDFVKRALCMPF
jgi:hypothetical protein